MHLIDFIVNTVFTSGLNILAHRTSMWSLVPLVPFAWVPAINMNECCCFLLSLLSLLTQKISTLD